MKDILIAILLSITAFRGHAQLHDTLLVFFPLDKNNLTEQATKTPDSLISNKVLQPGKPVILLGYGDYLGADEYNKNLSYARAKNVEDYLTLSGFNLKTSSSTDA